MAEINKDELFEDGVLRLPALLAKEFDGLADSIDRVKESLKKIEQNVKSAETIGDVKKEVSKLSEEEKQLLTVQKAIEKETAKQNDEYIEQSARLKDLRKQTADAVKEKQKAVSLYATERKRLNELGNQYREVALREGTASKAAKELRGEYTKLATRVNQVDRNLGKFNDNVGNYPTMFNNARMAILGYGAAIVGIIRAIGSALAITIRYEKANSTLRAVLGANKKETAELRKQQLLLGQSTAFSATQVADAQTELARLGKTSEQIINMTPSILQAAVVFGVDLAQAAELVASQLNAFQLNASEAARVSDVLAMSGNISALSFDSLAISLPKVAGAAKAVNIPIEETVAVLGAVVDNGIRAETAGVGFRNILIKSAESGKSYKESLKAISESTDQLTLATEMFGAENAVVAVNIANSTQKIEESTKALNSAAGAAEKFAKEQLDNLSGDITLLESAWEGFVLSVENGEGIFSRAIRAIIQEMTRFLELLIWTNTSSRELEDQKWTARTALGIQLMTDRLKDHILYQDKALSNEEKINGAAKEIVEQYDEKISRLIEEDGLNRDILTLQNDLESAILNGLKDEEQFVRNLIKLNDERNAVYEVANNLKSEEAAIIKANSGKEVKQTKEQIKYVGRLSTELEKLAEKYRLVSIAVNDELARSTDVLQEGSNKYLDAIDKEIKKRAYQVQLEKGWNDFFEREDDKKQKRREDLAEQGIEITNAIGEINQVAFQRRMQALDMEEQRYEEQKNRELFLAGDNELKREEIELRFAAKQEELRQRRINEERKAAIFDKALAISQAIINTALSVTSLGVVTPQAILAGILGAVQVGVIAAQPIPQYAVGTDDHPGGLAIVGEKGAELIKEPGKSPYLSDSAMLDLPKGTQVKTHEETISMLAMNAITRGYSDSTKPDDRAIKELRSIKKAIINKKEVNIVGESVGYTRRGNRVNYINSLRNK